MSVIKYWCFQLTLQRVSHTAKQKQRGYLHKQLYRNSILCLYQIIVIKQLFPKENCDACQLMLCLHNVWLWSSRIKFNATIQSYHNVSTLIVVTTFVLHHNVLLYFLVSVGAKECWFASQWHMPILTGKSELSPGLSQTCITWEIVIKVPGKL